MTTIAPPATGLLSRLNEHDRDRLGEGVRRLLTHGSILGFEPGQSETGDLKVAAPCNLGRAAESLPLAQSRA